MQGSRGFTLIEVVFTISIIIVLSTFTLHYVINSQPKITLEQQCDLIVRLLEESKSVAILKHQQIDIEISSNKIGYYGEAVERVIILNEHYYIDDGYDFHFNRNGNISSGGHLNICSYDRCKSIILNVGSGAFYVK